MALQKASLEGFVSFTLFTHPSSLGQIYSLRKQGYHQNIASNKLSTSTIFGAYLIQVLLHDSEGTPNILHVN